ncbi:hypothetical protein GCM10027056_22170 [Glaciibacter psychrotolerans]
MVYPGWFCRVCGRVGRPGHAVLIMNFNGSQNGGIHAPSTQGRDAPEHICGRCRTPLGKSAIRCPNEPETKEQDA